MIRVLFVRHRSLASLAIRLFTFGRWSHVALLTDTGTVIDATAKHGVAERSLEDVLYNASDYDVAVLSFCAPHEALSWARAQIGKKYDWLALVGFYFRSDMQDQSRWFCSELVANAITVGGEPLFRADAASRITPQHLWLLAPKA